MSRQPETTTTANGAPSRDDAGERLVTGLHLLAADDLLTERYRGQIQYPELVLTTAELAHATCPSEECDCEPRYCLACVKWAADWNAELDADAEGGSRGG